MPRTTTTTAQQGGKTRRGRKSKNATHTHGWVDGCWGERRRIPYHLVMSGTAARERGERKTGKRRGQSFGPKIKQRAEAKEGRGIQKARVTLTKQASKADQYKRLMRGLLCLLFFCLVLPFAACLPRLAKATESTTPANPFPHPIYPHLYTPVFAPLSHLTCYTPIPQPASFSRLVPLRGRRVIRSSRRSTIPGPRVLRRLGLGLLRLLLPLQQGRVLVVVH